MGKTIILGMPSDFYLYSLIKENLEHIGYEVISISFPQKNFKYKNIFQQVNNLYRKKILKDRLNKVQLRFSRHEKWINEVIDSLKGNADFALLIRPDIYPLEMINRIKSKSNYLVGYQWDGLNRFPWVKPLIKLFDKFLVFDPQDFTDASPPNLHLTTNFYFDMDRIRCIRPENNGKVYYLGTYERGRMRILNELTRKMKALKVKGNYFVYDRKKRGLIGNGICEQIFTPINYERNIKMVAESLAVIDIVSSVHQGLSFRVFEAILFNKKLITNATGIRAYDFYRPENVFIIGEDADEGLGPFLNSAYIPLPDLIKEQYRFENWMKSVLNLQADYSIDARKGG